MTQRIFKPAALLLLMAASLVGLSVQAHAAPIMVGWKDIPGGATWSSSGGPFQSSSPPTWGLTAKDPTKFDQLWFGFAGIEAGMDGGASLLGLVSGIGTDTAIWEGSDHITLHNGTDPILTRFTAQLGGGKTWINPGDVGIAGGPETVTEWDSSPLTVTFWLEASRDNGASWGSFFDVYDNAPTDRNCNRCAVSGFNTKYYYTEAAQSTVVPLPAAFPLMIAGFGVLGALGWRKRRPSA